MNIQKTLLLTLCILALSTIATHPSAAPEKYRTNSIPTLDFPIPQSPVQAHQNEGVPHAASPYEVNRSLDSSGSATSLTATPTISTTPSACAKAVKSGKKPAQQGAQRKIKFEDLPVELNARAAANAANRKKIFSSSRTASCIANEHSTAATAAGINPEIASKIAASGNAHLQSRKTRKNLSMGVAPIPVVTPRTHAPLSRRLSQATAAVEGNAPVTQNFLGGTQAITITGTSAQIIINNNGTPPAAARTFDCCVIL